MLKRSPETTLNPLNYRYQKLLLSPWKHQVVVGEVETSFGISEHPL